MRLVEFNNEITIKYYKECEYIIHLIGLIYKNYESIVKETLKNIKIFNKKDDKKNIIYNSKKISYKAFLIELNRMIYEKNKNNNENTTNEYINFAKNTLSKKTISIIYKYILNEDNILPKITNQILINIINTNADGLIIDINKDEVAIYSINNIIPAIINEEIDGDCIIIFKDGSKKKIKKSTIQTHIMLNNTQNKEGNQGNRTKLLPILGGIILIGGSSFFVIQNKKTEIQE